MLNYQIWNKVIMIQYNIEFDLMIEEINKLFEETRKEGRKILQEIEERKEDEKEQERVDRIRKANKIIEVDDPDYYVTDYNNKKCFNQWI